MMRRTKLSEETGKRMQKQSAGLQKKTAVTFRIPSLRIPVGRIPAGRILAVTLAVSAAFAGAGAATVSAEAAPAETVSAKAAPAETVSKEASAAAGTNTSAVRANTSASGPGVSAKLKNLDSYRPGDLIDERLIDFEDLSRYFVIYEIQRDKTVFSRINGRSYVDNNNISLSDLRYIQMPHYNFDGRIQLGEMIVNRQIADQVVGIFKELFRQKYQIEKMFLIDNYWTGDGESSDTNSIENNNTSAFCYRPATGSSNLSRHATGMAIDINPQQNPYVSYATGKPKWSHANANDYIARDTGLPHVITHDDLCFRLFQEAGFTWGGDWNTPKDYQHFERR